MGNRTLRELEPALHNQHLQNPTQLLRREMGRELQSNILLALVESWTRTALAYRNTPEAYLLTQGIKKEK